MTNLSGTALYLPEGCQAGQPDVKRSVIHEHVTPDSVSPVWAKCSDAYCNIDTANTGTAI